MQRRVRKFSLHQSARLVLCSWAALMYATVAQAADWPSKPIRIIVPYVPGGSADMLGRVLAQKLPDTLKQSVVVENRPGFTGVIGSELVAKSTPDGYTLVISGVGSHVDAPSMTRVPYDPVNDFTHIALLGGPPGVLAVTNASPARDLKSLIALSKTSPLSFGSAGTGTHGHITMEMFKLAANMEMTHIPYKGAGQAVGDLRAGHIPVAVGTLVAMSQQMKAGAIRPLAITADRRVPEFPDVPTFAELGYPMVVATTWFSLSGPARMPEDVTRLLNLEVRRAMKSADVRQRLVLEGIEASDMDSAQFTDFVRSEIVRWGPAAKRAALAKSG